MTKSCLHAATEPQPSKHRKNMVNALGRKGYGEGVGVTLVKAEGSVTQRAAKEGKGFFPAWLWLTGSSLRRSGCPCTRWVMSVFA